MSNNTSSSINQNSFLARFGATILRGGIAAIPNALFRHQAALQLKPQQVWFISTILSHQWDDALPYPSLGRMARQTGVSRRQLHNYQRQLVEMGLLEVINRETEAGGKTTNYYDFGPLFERLETFLAEEKERSGRARPYVNASSHTHGNQGSHTPMNASSHTHGNSSSHLKKIQKEDSEQEDSEPLETSNARKYIPQETEQASASEANPPPSSADTTATTMHPIGELLAQRDTQPAGTKQRPETLEEDYQRIQSLIVDRAREFNDTAPLKSSTTRAWGLYKRSGVSIQSFEERIFQAKALTQEATARIRKTAEDSEYKVRRKTKMAYFFAVLEDLLGLSDRTKKEQPKPPPAPQSPSRSDPEGKYRGVIQT